ncbi:MAG: hypothetical protein M1826_002509 [Phylliscum demangeonii]|nr:MAG: hypothetical protein M1826_002509 [Phylliscum demangeonii]
MTSTKGLAATERESCQQARAIQVLRGKVRATEAEAKGLESAWQKIEDDHFLERELSREKLQEAAARVADLERELGRLRAAASAPVAPVPATNRQIEEVFLLREELRLAKLDAAARHPALRAAEKAFDLKRAELASPRAQHAEFNRVFVLVRQSKEQKAKEVESLQKEREVLRRQADSPGSENAALFARADALPAQQGAAANVPHVVWDATHEVAASPLVLVAAEHMGEPAFVAFLLAFTDFDDDVTIQGYATMQEEEHQHKNRRAARDVELATRFSRFLSLKSAATSASWTIGHSRQSQAPEMHSGSTLALFAENINLQLEIGVWERRVDILTETIDSLRNTSPTPPQSPKPPAPPKP